MKLFNLTAIIRVGYIMMYREPGCRIIEGVNVLSIVLIKGLSN